MTIVSRQKIREAVARAMLLDCEAGEQAAVESVAQVFALPVEAVLEALQPVQEAACHLA